MFGYKHQHTRKHQQYGSQNLLTTQASNNDIFSMIAVHHLYIGKENGSQGIQVRRKLPTCDLQHRSYQQQHGTSHLHICINLFHSSNIKMSSLGFFIKYFSRAIFSIASGFAVSSFSLRVSSSNC